MAKIIINIPDEAPVKYDLGGEEQLTVGRAAENDIVIEHDSISGQHARFVLIDGQYHLVDSQSTNGTFADGVEAADTPLHNGVQIVFGSVPCDYECDEFAGAEAPAEQAEADQDFAGGAAGATGIQAEISETSARPPGFKDMSPVEKIEKKDTIGQVAMILGIVAILAAIGLAAISFTL